MRNNQKFRSNHKNVPINITKITDTIEEVLEQLHNLETKYKSNVDDKLLKDIQSFVTKLQIFVETNQQENLNYKKIFTEISKELELLRKKNKNLDQTTKNLPVNITKNTEKIEEVLKQLRNLKTNYKSNVDGKLLKDIQSFNIKLQTFVENNQQENLNYKKTIDEISKKIELLR